MDDEKTLYRIDILERENREIKLEIAAIEARNEARDTDRAAQERKQLIAGIMFLGGVIMSLAGVIWSYRGVIFRGEP